MKKWIFLTFAVLLFVSCGSMESVDDKLKIATAAVERGEYHSAVTLLKEVLQEDSRNTKARFLLGNIYYRAGDYETARKEFNKAYENGMNNKELQRLRFSVIRRSQDFDELNKLLMDNVASAHFSEGDKLAIQGWIKIGEKNNTAAQKMFEDSLTRDAANLEALLGRVQVFINDRKFPKALDAVDAVLTKYTDDPDATLIKASIIADMGRLEEAEKLLQEMLAKETQNSATRRGMNARFTLIQILKMQGKHDEVSKIVKQAYRLMPNNPLAQYYMGFDHYKNKNFASAKDLLTKVINALPSHNPSLLLMGTINFEESNWEQASFYLNRFLADNPEHKPALKMLGVTQLKLNQSETALQTLQPVLDDGDFGIMSLAGAASIASGDLDKGIDYLKSAIKQDPDNLKVRLELANTYYQAGEKKSAENELLSATAIDDSNHRALALLINFYVKENMLEKALALLNKELKNNSDSAFHHTMLGMIQSDSKDYNAAINSFKKALDLDGSYWQAKLNLAKNYLFKNDNDMAGKVFQDLISSQPNNSYVSVEYARYLIAAERISDAITHLEKVTKNNTNDIRSARLLISLYERQGEKDKLTQQLTKMSENEKSRGLALHLRGQSQMRARDIKGAVTTHEEFVNNYPKSAEGYYHLAKAYLADNKVDSARDSLTQALDLNESFIPALTLKARIELLAKNFSAAEAVIDLLIKQQPTNDIGYELKGDMLVLQDKHAQAIEQYKTAAKYSQDIRLVFKQAKSFENMKETKKAISLLEKMLTSAKDEQRPMIQAELVKAYHLLNDKSKVLNILTKMNESSLNNPFILNDMAWYAHYYDLNLAEQIAGKAFQLRSDLAAIKDTYGWIMFKNGKADKSIELLKSASELAPTSDEMRFHLAVAYFETGKTSEAKPLFESLKQTKNNFEGKSEIDEYLDKF